MFSKIVADSGMGIPALTCQMEPRYAPNRAANICNHIALTEKGKQCNSHRQQPVGLQTWVRQEQGGKEKEACTWREANCWQHVVHEFNRKWVRVWGCETKVILAVFRGNWATACCCRQIMFWRDSLWVVCVWGSMRGAGALMVWSVSMPGPHSHPAAVEKGGKDINRPSGIRAHWEEWSGGICCPAGTQWHWRVAHKHRLHILYSNISQQTRAYINLIRTPFCLGSDTGVNSGQARRGPCMMGQGDSEKIWGHVVLWRGVSTCVKPPDRKGGTRLCVEVQ